MKTKDVARQHGIDQDSFEHWLKETGQSFKVGALSISVDDADVPGMVASFQEHTRARAAAAAEAEAEATRAAQEKQRALASILITSGFNFDGYTVSRYSGYISGDDAISVDRGSQGLFGTGATDVASSLMSSMRVMRRNALAELKEAAHALGCNAVIGVDFDYITLDPETAGMNGSTYYLPYVFGVTANGNAVVIEKNLHPNL